uniref:Uncharacterized protein n=1 Tax=Chrysotila carterae TaxID=13221 RepID=A0A7S4B0N5_CHRCT
MDGRHGPQVRTAMTGGRMVKVQSTKYNTASYYKQASRAGEGFGNRSSPRFRDLDPTHLGPGKYSPSSASSRVSQKSSTSEAKSFSGKLHTTAPRFQETSRSSSQTPGPGRYRPKHTLTDSRHAL